MALVIALVFFGLIYSCKASYIPHQDKYSNTWGGDGQGVDGYGYPAEYGNSWGGNDYYGGLTENGNSLMGYDSNYGIGKDSYKNSKNSHSSGFEDVGHLSLRERQDSVGGYHGSYGHGLGDGLGQNYGYGWHNSFLPTDHYNYGLSHGYGSPSVGSHGSSSLGSRRSAIGNAHGLGDGLLVNGNLGAGNRNHDSNGGKGGNTNSSGNAEGGGSGDNNSSSEEDSSGNNQNSEGNRHQVGTSQGGHGSLGNMLPGNMHNSHAGGLLPGHHVLSDTWSTGMHHGGFEPMYSDHAWTGKNNGWNRH